MGCLSAKCGIYSEAIRATTGISFERLCATTGRAVESINVRCGLICSVSTLAFLRVNPDVVAWVDEYNDFTYHVQSNRDWRVE